VTSYVIEAGSAPTLANLANFSTGNALTIFQASGVGPGTYYVRVRAQNAAAISAASNEVVVTVGMAMPPGPPTGLSATFRMGSVQLLWIAPASGDRPFTYLIQFGSSSGASDVATVQTGNANTFFDARAGLLGVYHARVVAANAAGVSPASNEVLVDLPGHGTCFGPFEPPTGLVASVTGATLTLNFTPPRFDGSSVVRAGTATGTSDLGHFDVGYPPVVFAGVPRGTYFISVAGRNRDCGVGPFSNEVAITIQ
jgi:hypothetical protein